MAEVPHFALPFNLKISADVVEQDTIEDVADCVYVMLRTPPGYRPEAPTFGIDDMAFVDQPVNLDEVRAQIVQNDPRAEVNLLQSPDRYDELILRVSIELNTRGGI